MALELITRTTAARMRDQSVRTIDRLISTGQLTAYRLGSRSIRLDRAEVEALAVPVDDGQRIASLEKHIQRALAEAPPLSNEQRDRIARLLVSTGAA